jgi:hypothetical protein
VRPGGIFSQWVQNYYLPEDDLRSIIAAFQASFPNVLLFETFEGVDLLLLGSEEPLALDLARIEERMAELRVRMDLARVHVRRPEDLLPLFRLGPAEVRELVAGAPRNTDDNARVEFSAPKALYLDTLDSNLEMIGKLAVHPREYVATGEGRSTETVRLEFARALMRRGLVDDAEREARSLLGGPLDGEAGALLERIGR